jgi:hypothetical protein
MVFTFLILKIAIKIVATFLGKILIVAVVDWKNIDISSKGKCSGD